MSLTALTLAIAVKDEARRLGFDAVGIGPATPVPHGDAFDRWLDDGYGGTMEYLARTRRERRDPSLLLPGVRAIVAVALSYHAGGDPPADDGTMRVARYAGAGDYHEVIRPRLQALADFVSRAAGAGARSRAAVDTSAVLERDVAARAGLGWIGKNANLIRPSLGSWFFIGVVLTTAEPAFDAEQPDRCGTCTACLDACPTEAFRGPYVLDARRCIAYLTIEHRGDIDEALRPGIGEWGFGCDVCQEVCPWNRRAATTTEPTFASLPRLTPEEVLHLDAAEFRTRFRTTALWRAQRSGLLRNAAIVLGNRGDVAADPALRRALHDGDPVVQRAAAWALTRLSPRAGPSVESTTVRVGTQPAHSPSREGSQLPRQGGHSDMDQKRDQREMGRDRNEAETGEPLQLDEKQKMADKQGTHEQGGQERRGGEQHGGGQQRPDSGHGQPTQPGQHGGGQRPGGTESRPK